MAEDKKGRYIQYLAEQNQDLKLIGKAMLKSQHSELLEQLSGERKFHQSAERKVKFLQEKRDCANQERFGDRRQQVKSKAGKGSPKKDDPDRKKEKDDFDGTDDTLRTDSVDNNWSQEVQKGSKKGRDFVHSKNKFVKAVNQGGEFTAERTMKKLTTQRNNSLHYGSDVGAEMAATYHSVIGTVKLHGSSVWNFIGTFFKNIFNGCRAYVNMVPAKITLATSQC